MVVAVWSAPLATLIAVAVNAATEVEGGWPGPLGWIQAHPWRWAAGLTLLAALTTFVASRWQPGAQDVGDPGEHRAMAPGTPTAAALSGTGVVGRITGDTVDVARTIPEPPLPTSPPPVFNLPGRNPDFTGREDLLREVEAGLDAGPVAVVAVRGMGGIGKTQLALEVAHRGWAAGRYEVAWWVRAESPLTVAEDLAALAPGLGVPVVADQEAVVAGVRAELARRDRWLVVFDNAPDAAAVREWLPSGPGHVLVTSRSLEWRGLAGVALRLAQFTPAESAEFLTRRTGQSNPAVRELAQELGFLPLALAQAAAYMERHDGLSAERYLALLRDRRNAGRLLAQGLDGYPASVATTWLMHFEWLAEHAPAALQLLRFCAFLDPDDINLGLLLSTPAPDGPAGELWRACRSPLDLEQVVGDLLSTALVTRVADDRVRMHRLVGEVTRHQLAASGADRYDSWAVLTVAVLSTAVPDGPSEPAAWPVMLDLAPHLAAATELAPAAAATATALTQLGQYLAGRGEFTAARARLRRALTINEAVHGPDHPETAVALGSLGLVERELGEPAAARAHLRRALAVFEAEYGPDHPQVAITLGNLATVEHELGEPTAARAGLQRALAISEASFGPDHPQAAVILGTLGIVEHELGEQTAAIATLRRALAVNEAVYGPDHPKVAVTLGNLGIVEHELGEQAAIATLRRALSILEAAYGPDHPHAVATRDNLRSIEA
ncbi:FxSxx-COOH system tetratricopeptide repeat protein [Catellatospora sp. NPDC049609]|uniref:FxSxx-COOH system tetratricopeptide repeat protein n=1 Tax=Catellatospora sp. NPDC049609 TaxID=3155505 RepID=UPI00342F71F2